MRRGEAEPLLRDLQARWPEWAPPWVAHGIILAAHQKPEEGRQALEKAVALGAHSPEVRTAVALGARSPEVHTALTAGDAQRPLAPGDARLLLHKLFQQKPPGDW